LSETFVLHELLELERVGVRLHVIALRRPEEVVQHEALARLRAEVEYLPELSDSAPGLAVRVAHAALALRHPRRYLDALAEAIASPDFSRPALRRSVVLAHRLVRLGSPPLYLHFANKPATVGRLAALFAGVRYGMSAHAKDIWLTPRAELARKVRSAEVVLTCTSDGRRYLTELAGGRTPVVLAHHGVEARPPLARHRASTRPVVLSVGRLVEKKGHATLVRAAALLAAHGLDFTLRIAGEGAEWSRLQRLCHDLRVGERVAFLGPLTASEVEAEYARADVFALACEELSNGDRDGIPNVLLEAMSHGLPVVSTTCAGIREAVPEGRCGLLVPQRDDVAFAHALATVLLDASLRARLGGAAREHVAAHFDRGACFQPVIDALRSAGLIGIGGGQALDESRDRALRRAA
jgi:glycosyltransferase involved in cell wall biosynthesis